MSSILPYDKLDPRVQRTIDILYDAFQVLLKDKHYKFIKVQEIVEKAHLNRATFYLHFENKRDFIYFCVRDGFRRELGERLSDPNFSYNAMNLKLFIGWTLRYIDKTYSLWNYQWEEILFESGTRDAIHYFLLNWIKMQDDPTIYSPTVINTCSMVLSSAITGLGLMWCHNGCKESVDLLTDQITDLFIGGLPCLYDR